MKIKYAHSAPISCCMHALQSLEAAEGTKIQSYSGAATEVQSASEAAPLTHSSTVAATEIPHSAAASEEDEEISQGLERLESAGEAACCLNDTFEVGSSITQPVLCSTELRSQEHHHNM